MHNNIVISYILQPLIFYTLLLVVALPFGEYMAQVFTNKKNILSFAIQPLENFCYKIFGVNSSKDMNWKEFSLSLIAFNLVGLLVLFLLQIIQQWLPYNPDHLQNIRWDTAINTAISFTTNTNWQSYNSETTTSHIVKMLGLTVQNFLSAGTGIAVAIALINSFIRKTTKYIGNFWTILTKSILYILLPLAILFSIFLVSQGSIQNFNATTTIQTIEKSEQKIAQGPVASEISIKHLGTNGGGFFTANSAHPYENPNQATDYLQIFAMLLIVIAFPFTFGAMLNRRKQGFAIFVAMGILYALGLVILMWSELHGNPLLSKIGIDHGINMEGKEVRFGTLSSSMFAMTTTATATGAVNALHNSFMPLSSLVMLFNMTIGEVIFGGVGLGISSMLCYAILTMFLIGLMVGRSPEIYGKKLEPFEMLMVSIVLLGLPVIQLILESFSVSHMGNALNSGANTITSVMYTFASTIGNNGSSFASVATDNVFFNIITSIAMLVGRFATIIPILAIAGNLSQKQLIPLTSRFPTTSPTFIIMLVVIVLIVGSLTFLPLFVLGPILEHLTIFA